MWSSSKRASASTYLGSWIGSWTRVQGAQSRCSTTELSTHPWQGACFPGKVKAMPAQASQGLMTREFGGVKVLLWIGMLGRFPCRMNPSLLACKSTLSNSWCWNTFGHMAFQLSALREMSPTTICSWYKVLREMVTDSSYKCTRQFGGVEKIVGDIYIYIWNMRSIILNHVRFIFTIIIFRWIEVWKAEVQQRQKGHWKLSGERGQDKNFHVPGWKKGWFLDFSDSKIHQARNYN